jgi:hypothetical protein
LAFFLAGRLDDMAPGPGVAFWPAPAPGMLAGGWPFGGTPASLAS